MYKYTIIYTLCMKHVDWSLDFRFHQKVNAQEMP